VTPNVLHQEKYLFLFLKHPKKNTFTVPATAEYMRVVFGFSCVYELDHQLMFAISVTKFCFDPFHLGE